MKSFFASLILIFCTLIVPASLIARRAHDSCFSSPPQHQHDEARARSFGVAAFDRFHEVLHPLQHDALPKGDYKTIRARAAKLVSLGKPLTNMAAPRGTSDISLFKNKQKAFAKALSNFKRDARRGTDEQLKISYSAVHDSFEELVGLLPRN